METIKNLHPIAWGGIVTVIAVVIFAIIKLNKKDDETRFAEMQMLRGPAIDTRERPGNEQDGTGTGRGNRDVDVFGGTGMSGEYTPMDTGDPLCSDTPNICPVDKVIINSITRGTTEQECCRRRTCEKDFDPRTGGGGCEDEPTPTGVGSMVYNSDMTTSQKNYGRTASECCIYEPPTCSTVLNQGDYENDGCGTNFMSMIGGENTYDATVNEQKCNSLYTKNANSTTGYYECEWDESIEKCVKKTTTLSPAGIECSPPSSQTCVHGNSWQTGGTTTQANCTCPSSDPLKNHGSLWRCLA